jgi:Uma2 family endonuclease
MSIVTEKFIPLQRFVFTNLDWAAYENIVNAVGDKRLRHTYADGALEIMSPSYAHESYKEFFAQLVLTLAEELGLGIRSSGSMRMKPRLDQLAIEADATFFIAHETEMRGKRDWVLGRDPPPDLAVEIDISNSSIPRLPIYKLLRIPELWRYDGAELSFLALDANGEYSPLEESNAFHHLRPEHLMPFLEDFAVSEQTSVIRGFRKWIADQLID